MLNLFKLKGPTRTEAFHITYHYKLKHWDKFQVKELAKAPEYDGHTPSDITRLYSLLETTK